MTIEPMTDADWEQIKEIYRQGIASGDATFETSAPGWDEWNGAHASSPRLVALDGGSILGWAALTPVSRRSVYKGVGEVSVYVATRAWGRGIGRALLRSLVAESEKAGFWTLQSSIFPENKASLQIHIHCGFRIIGRRERIGRMDGLWRDTVLLERRSTVAGID